MRIWIFNQYASTPDRLMTGAFYLAKALAARGHQVTVFAAGFEYYSRRELRLRGGEWSRRERRKGVEFVWVRTVSYDDRLWRRALNMASYFASAMAAALGRRDRPDVVMGSCPHPLAVLGAFLVASAKRARFVYEIRDLWPQTFVDRGTFSSGHPLVRVLRLLERFLLQRASLVVSVLPHAHEYVESLGLDPSKVVWIPNGVEVAAFEAPADRRVSGRWASQGRRADEILSTPRPDRPRTFMYLGGLNHYQGLETVLEAARLLQEDGVRDARFVIVGRGFAKDELVDLAAGMGLRNCEFREAVPRARVAEVLAEADVLVFHLRKLSVLRYGMSPNKLCDYLAAGKPILCAAQARNDPVREAGAGISVPPEEPQALAQAVQDFLRMPREDLAAMGARGREYARAHLDVGQLATRLEAELARVAA